MRLFKRLYKKAVTALNLFQDKNITPDFKPLLTNIFSTSYEKTCLVSLVTFPFRTKSDFYYHSIETEMLTLCDIMNDLKFKVDVIDYDQNLPKLNYHYTSIIGFGQPIDDYIKRNSNKDYSIIIYRNGADSSFSDKVSLKRILDFYKIKNQFIFDSILIYPKTHRIQIYLADRIIVLGNKIISNTYLNETQGEISNVNLFFHDVSIEKHISTKIYEDVQNTFLWFGSRGAIHKGLDILLEYFSKKPKLKLLIAGLNQSESEFMSLYKSHLESENIINLGFVKMESIEFIDLMKNVGSIISPSLCEGGAGATLNCVANGRCFPIITKEVGLDFDGNEIIIKDFSIQAIQKSVLEVISLPTHIFKQRAINASEFIRMNHKLCNYKSNLKEILKNEVDWRKINN